MAASDLRGVLEVSNDLVALFESHDGTARRLYSSPSHYHVLGHSPESCNGELDTLKHLYTKEFLDFDGPRLVAAFDMNALTHGYKGELVLLNAEGHKLQFEFKVALIASESSKCLILYRSITDERERVKLEVERRANQSQLELSRMFNASFDLVTMIEVRNGTSVRLYSSKSHEVVLGHTPESCNGDCRTLQHIYPIEYLTNELPKLIAAFEAGEIPNGFMGELPLLHVNGHTVFFEYRVSLDLERPEQLSIICRDITDRRERQCLELDKARLEVELKMDNDAVHTISHQLKNRFIALKGLVQSVRGSVQDYAPQLLQEPHCVRETITDSLNLLNGGIRVCLNETIIRMITHDQYTRTDAEFDIHTELEQLCGTRIKLVIDLNVPQRIMSDLNLILHVAENFTSNAGKYGLGEVTLRVSVLPPQRLLISVHNDPGEKHEELRERFGTDSSSLFDGGVGIHANAFSTRKGLSIAKKCATILGGDVNIRFEPTEVVATLESSYTILPASLCLPTSTLIASVEDSALIRKMDCAMMGQMNIDIESAQHVRGSTAEEIRNFPEYVMLMKRQPTLVILDQNLDHPANHTEFMKGTELTCRLRELDFKGKIVIKSANATPDHARSYMACGADGVVAKGLNASDLNRQLACILFGMHTLPMEVFDPRLLHDFQLDARRELADEFLLEVKELLTKLQEAIQSGDYAHADLILHGMKGVCINMGARRVSEMCGMIRGRTMEKKEWEAELVNLSGALQQAFDFIEQIVAKDA